MKYSLDSIVLKDIFKRESKYESDLYAAAKVLDWSKVELSKIQ